MLQNNPYTFDFSLDKFKQILKNDQEDEWYTYVYSNLHLYNINTVERVSGFLAQTAHESQDYNVLVENLNYSAKRLCQVWPKRFPNLSVAKRYERNPERLANKVYANRMGNGPEESGDGWKFRGRGIIQCTGRSNYTAASKFLFDSLYLVENPQAVYNDKDVCVKVACWYWTERKINNSCDRKDIVSMTRLVNGGTVGLEDRRFKFNKNLSILK